MKPALLLTLAFASSALASAPDWPQWRGPKSDGISPEKGLLKEWPSDGPPLAWRTKGVGNGMSSISIAGGQLHLKGKIIRVGLMGETARPANVARFLSALRDCLAACRA